MKEPLFPTYQTISALLVLQGTSQFILMTECLIVFCLHDKFVHVRKPLHCLDTEGAWAQCDRLQGTAGAGHAGCHTAGVGQPVLGTALGLCPVTLLRQRRPGWRQQTCLHVYPASPEPYVSK